MFRERYAGLYASVPYAIAQGTVEIPYLLIQSAIFTCIVYSMIHFEWDAGKSPLAMAVTQPQHVVGQRVGVPWL